MLGERYLVRAMIAKEMRIILVVDVVFFVASVDGGMDFDGRLPEVAAMAAEAAASLVAFLCFMVPRFWWWRRGGREKGDDGDGSKGERGESNKNDILF